MRDLRKLPKADLHCHLEGSARPTTIQEFADKYGVTVGSSQDFNDITTFLQRFEEVRSVIRSIEDLERVAREFIEDTAQSGGVYCEVDWAPHFYTNLEGLHTEEHSNQVDEVFERVHSAMTNAADESGISFGHLMGVDKTNPLQAEEIARFAVAHKQHGVVSFGFAGNEAVPHSSMHPAVQIAIAGGLAFIPHAGELRSAESVAEVLDFGPKRIAHGFRATEDAEILSCLKDSGVACDVALSSNLGLGIVSNIETHPVRDLLANGIPVTLNTDDALFFGSSLNDEYELARTSLGLSDETLAQLATNSNVYCGADPEWKRRQIEDINQWLSSTA